MDNTNKNKEQLLAELSNLRHQHAVLQQTHAHLRTDLEVLQSTNQILEQSEAQCRRIVEEATQGILIHQSGYIRYVNDAFLRMFRYQHLKDLLNRSTMETLVDPAFRDEMEARSAAASRGVPQPAHTWKAVRQDGSRIWVQTTGSAIPFEGGMGLLGFYTDVTAHKQAEEALRGSEARFRNLVEGSIQGIVIHRDFKPLFANQAYADLFGYESPDDILRMDHLVQQVAAPHEHARLMGYANARMQGKEAPSQHEYQGIRKDGSLLWVDNRARVIHWAGSSAILSTTFDITERKLAEDALRRMNDTLEEQVAERTAALTAANDTLRHEIIERKQAEEQVRKTQQQLLERQRHEAELAQAKLDELSQQLIEQIRLATIGQMSASIAHEIRNPLATVRNAVYYLKRRAPTEPQILTQYLNLIDQEVYSADRVIHNILEMARSKEPSKASFELSRTVRDVFERMDGEASVQCRLGCSPEPFMIVADQAQLYQVLDNLVSNAVQAMNGSGEIRVEIRRADDHDQITVQDSGPGIAPEHRDRLFEPLFTSKAKGTGLGLTICRQIIESHGGTIELQHHEGPGATFCIRLPRQIA